MLEPPRSSAKAPYTLCYLCGGVFPVGSMRFDVLQQPRTNTGVWGGSTVPKLFSPTSLKGKQGVQGAAAV